MLVQEYRTASQLREPQYCEDWKTLLHCFGFFLRIIPTNLIQPFGISHCSMYRRPNFLSEQHDMVPVKENQLIVCVFHLFVLSAQDNLLS